MWEKVKENGFNIASIGVVTANLVLFVLIGLRGVAQVWEPSRAILLTEIAICLALISWGVERLGKDLLK